LPLCFSFLSPVFSALGRTKRGGPNGSEVASLVGDDAERTAHTRPTGG
jgi:hypothetical protein